MDMDDVFGDPAEKPESPQGEQQTQEPAQAEPANEAGAPPAPNTEKHVPLAALEAVRNDYKGKSAKLEGELEAIRAERDRLLEAQRQPQSQPRELSIQEQSAAIAEKRFLDTSELIARQKHGDEVVTKAYERMVVEFAKDPALHAQVLRATDPWDEMVKRGKRQQALDAIGDDPETFETRLREKWEAEKAAAQPEQSSAPRLPQSLADARSAGARGATFTGPTPLDSMFPN